MTVAMTRRRRQDNDDNDNDDHDDDDDDEDDKRKVTTCRCAREVQCVDVTIEVAGRQERRQRIKRDDDDGDDDDGEKDDHKINSKSSFCPPQSRKGTITYSACVLGVWLRYRRQGKHVVSELKWQ